MRQYAQMVRWSGFCWIAAGGLVALATLIHPSKETAQTVLAQEGRLITAHWLFTFFCALFLLGLPGIYAAHAGQFGRIGLAGLLLLFFGGLFFAVSGDYGFNAPVLARLAPQTLDAINAYPPVAGMDGLFVLLLLAGFILLAIALPRGGRRLGWPGLLLVGGWVLFMAGAALSQSVAEPLWALAVLGAALLGLGLAWVGYEVAAEQPHAAAAGLR